MTLVPVLPASSLPLMACPICLILMRHFVLLQIKQVEEQAFHLWPSAGAAPGQPHTL